MTAYIEYINTALRVGKESKALVVDLFAGCGGLALGFEAQGFKTIGFEMNTDACQTYEMNLKRKCHQVFLTPTTPLPFANVIIGGPPCQPFSVGGYQMGLQDSRDGFPAFIAAIARVQPDIWLFENVRGLLYQNKWYLHEITRTLRESEMLNHPASVSSHESSTSSGSRAASMEPTTGMDKHFRFPKANRLYLIEAVHSSGPISNERRHALEALVRDTPAYVVYITAFQTWDKFRQHAPSIGWETEVWVAEAPEHLIHYNGEKFLPKQ
jgi:hypothetical protein